MTSIRGVIKGTQVEWDLEYDNDNNVTLTRNGITIGYLDDEVNLFSDCIDNWLYDKGNCMQIRYKEPKNEI